MIHRPKRKRLHRTFDKSMKEMQKTAQSVVSPNQLFKKYKQQNKQQESLLQPSPARLSTPQVQPQNLKFKLPAPVQNHEKVLARFSQPSMDPGYDTRFKSVMLRGDFQYHSPQNQRRGKKDFNDRTGYFLHDAQAWLIREKLMSPLSPRLRSHSPKERERQKSRRRGNRLSLDNTVDMYDMNQTEDLSSDAFGNKTISSLVSPQNRKRHRMSSAWSDIQELITPRKLTSYISEEQSHSETNSPELDMKTQKKEKDFLSVETSQQQHNQDEFSSKQKPPRRPGAVSRLDIQSPHSHRKDSIDSTPSPRSHKTARSIPSSSNMNRKRHSVVTTPDDFNNLCKVIQDSQKANPIEVRIPIPMTPKRQSNHYVTIDPKAYSEIKKRLDVALQQYKSGDDNKVDKLVKATLEEFGIDGDTVSNEDITRLKYHSSDDFMRNNVFNLA